jgi:diguanylate cyclase (GGDEF)-like protein/PAS domain S-box-containing protein
MPQKDLSMISKQLQWIIDATPNGLIICDQKGNIVLVNSSAENSLGYHKGELLGKCVDILVPEASRGKHAEMRGDYFARPAVKQMGAGRELAAARQDGTEFPIEIGLSPIDIDGEPFVISSIIDITERKRAEAAVREADQRRVRFEKQKLSQVLSIEDKVGALRDMHTLCDFIVDRATEILEAEKCSLMLLDQETQELLIKAGKGIDEETVKKTRVKLGEQIAGKVAREGKPLLIGDMETDSPASPEKDLPYKTKSCLSVPIFAHDQLIGVVNVFDKNAGDGSTAFTDTDLRILTTIVRRAAVALESVDHCRALEQLSLIDPLTGLYNYRYFIQRLDQEVHRLERYPKPLSLLRVDVDNFRSYNDAYGHDEGDELLREIGRILQDKSRKTDVVCRYAGDEFAVILPETGVAGAVRIAEDIRDAVAGMSVPTPVRVTTGIAAHGKGRDRRDLIVKADQALSQAKKECRGDIYSL